MVNNKTIKLEHLYYINKAVKPFMLLNESDTFSGVIDTKNPNQVSWENVEKNISTSTKNIKDLNNAKDYLALLHNKIKRLPNNVKIKILNVALIGFSALMLSNTSKTNDEVISKLPTEVKGDILKTNNPILDDITNVETNVKIERTRSHSDVLLDFLKYEEGSIKRKGEPVLTAYNLGDGAVTIGWGHAERKSKSKMVAGETSITIEQAEKLLTKDIAYASKMLNKILDKKKIYRT